MARPSLLIEHWLPIEALGAESQRERGASSALPPLYFLHVWWARRPLTTSRAAILASVLPQWRADWPSSLQDKFPTEATYHNWFTRLVGILGDPVRARKVIEAAKKKKIKLPGSPYGYARAFTQNPSVEDLETLGQLLEHTWGTRDVTVMDPMAGGGSIPFESLRFGFTTIANELNPVASVILKATLDYPARFGVSLADDIRKYGAMWAERVKKELEPYFPKQKGENIFAYIWARTVACPTTGKPVPLSPNWWLAKGDNPVAVKLLADPKWDACRFEIVHGKTAAAKAKPDEGTIKRGEARSPWTGEAIDGEYIKREAQAGRMGQQLYAVGLKKSGGMEFRAPTDEDSEAVTRAEKALKQRLPGWEAKGLLPREPFPEQSNDPRPLTYGMPTWADFFSPRQLLAMGTFLETRKEVCIELRKELDPDRASAIETYLGLMLDGAAVYNNRNCRFNPERGIRSSFDRHDFAFVSSPAEFDASVNLIPWVVFQQEDAYTKIAKLTSPSQAILWSNNGRSAIDRLIIGNSAAQNLGNILDGSVVHISVDPPYYDNVMYAELSDFFYVWMKRSLGSLYPEFFTDELTNKDDEAVANPARFASTGSKKKKLAEQDYERKMAACFREMNRVLHPDGVLTVMFTHKRVEAWDTLGSALINAGFSVKASWPVHTESEHSLHQAKKNAAASTILLICRKRPANSEPVWWDDIKSKVRQKAREAAQQFGEAGIKGVDLYISTFGPVLSVISEQWPVLTAEVDEKTGQPRPLRPEAALDIAREEVIALRKRGLLQGRDARFDPVTDWYLMAWDAFRAAEFPADEARKLAIALGVDLEATLVREKRLIAKKASSVVLQEPTARRKKGMVDPEAESYASMVDALHTALLVLEEDGDKACERFLKKTGLLTDSTFKACLQSAINAIPAVRPEATDLERLRSIFFGELTPAPQEPEPEISAVQMPLLEAGETEEGEESEEDGDDEEGKD